MALIVAVAEFYFLLTRLMKIDQPKPEKKTKFVSKKISTVQVEKGGDVNVAVKNLTLKKND